MIVFLFGDDCQTHLFDDDCQTNMFYDDCQTNMFYDDCQTNLFDDVSDELVEVAVDAELDVVHEATSQL
jgi:hypothetical protein